MPNNTSKPPKTGQGDALAKALSRHQRRNAPGPRRADLRKGPDSRSQRRGGGRPKLFPGRTGGR